MNTTIQTAQLLSQLKWRYATKQFDTARPISDADWAALEEALLLSPSSAGLQPWAFLVVNDPATRAKLRPAAYGQAQVTDAARLVVFASKLNYGESDVDAHLQRVAAVRGMPVEALAPYRAMVVGSIVQGQDEAGRNAWARNQAYIALGIFLASAAVLGIDACPMEGFDRAQFDQILGLRERGLASAVIATAGYRSSDDKYAAAPKVRFPKEKIVLEI